MRLYAGTACLVLCAGIYAEVHAPVPQETPSFRAEAEIDVATGSDAVLRELQRSIDELYSVSRDKGVETSSTGEKEAAPLFWSMPR